MDMFCNYDYNLFDNSYPLPIYEGVNKTKEQILLIATIYFAKDGYASVSMRDIAKVMGVQQSSLYNHFESKEMLWQDVLEHAKSLYLLYFSQLDSVLATAESFESVLETIFHEPKRLANAFTNYAFSMIHSEQFHNETAGKIFAETFLTYSIDFLQGWFDKCVAKGLTREFDTKTVATIIMHSVLIGIEVNVHKQLKHTHMLPYDPGTMLSDLQRFILNTVAPPTAQPPPDDHGRA